MNECKESDSDFHHSPTRLRFLRMRLMCLSKLPLFRSSAITYWERAETVQELPEMIFKNGSVSSEGRIIYPVRMDGAIVCVKEFR